MLESISQNIQCGGWGEICLFHLIKTIKDLREHFSHVIRRKEYAIIKDIKMHLVS